VVAEINERGEIDEETGEVRSVRYGVIEEDAENDDVIEKDKIE